MLTQSKTTWRDLTQTRCLLLLKFQQETERITTSFPAIASTYGAHSDSWLPKRIKVFPKSLSVFDMMKLGKVTQKKATTTIELHSFGLEAMGWSATASTAEFNARKDPFAEGGFRKAD